MTDKLQDALNGFLLAAQDVYNDYIKVNGFTMTDKLSYTVGRKYIKVIQGSSVHTFINMENGDILKPASFKSPAKHARGNVYTKDFGKSCLTPHGPKYL